MKIHSQLEHSFYDAGSNITLTPDATNDKITIAATDTTYGNATTSAAGLMTAAMVTKLNGKVKYAQLEKIDGEKEQTNQDICIYKGLILAAEYDNTEKYGKISVPAGRPETACIGH